MMKRITTSDYQASRDLHAANLSSFPASPNSSFSANHSVWKVEIMSSLTFYRQLAKSYSGEILLSFVEDKQCQENNMQKRGPLVLAWLVHLQKMMEFWWMIIAMLLMGVILAITCLLCWQNKQRSLYQPIASEEDIPLLQDNRSAFHYPFTHQSIPEEAEDSYQFSASL